MVFALCTRHAFPKDMPNQQAYKYTCTPHWVCAHQGEVMTRENSASMAPCKHPERNLGSQMHRNSVHLLHCLMCICINHCNKVTSISSMMYLCIFNVSRTSLTVDDCCVSSCLNHAAMSLETAACRSRSPVLKNFFS